ncbi:MAG: hypothetical protein A2808_00035 [Candidatus Moranbacteria bacterium RIFCSPHIGHO2_01_FULL_55_24]|nr:MAG: hypothetical protein A2808_00035 [Candidatus Moranbacteria bacterium RIFCSPHIGHO2_01_FULL_55_24]
MSESLTKQVKAGAFLLLAFAALAYTYQYGRSVNQAFPNRTFTVDGEADVETPHDVASFTATVVTEGGKEVATLQAQNTEKMNALNAFLKEQGISGKDLQTKNYSLTPRYQYSNCLPGTTCPPPAISGYTITQSLEVRVRNMDILGALLAGVVEKGANTVSGVSFVTDDDEDARNDAREEAFKEARKKAQSIAKAGGFRLGKLVSFYEDNGLIPADMNYGMGGSELSVKSAAPVIEPGTEKGKLKVVLTYEIKN